jgi:hypothetical protein
MNTKVMEKIGAVMSEPGFYEKYKDVATAEELLAAVKQEVPEATVEEIDQFLTKVSEQLQDNAEELSESDLENVAGGLAITFTVAGVCAVIKGAAVVGGAVGTLYWYYKHRNC